MIQMQTNLDVADNSGRAPRHVHQSAGWLEAQICHHWRRDRRIGERGDTARDA